MGKSQKNRSIKLIPKALQILEYYTSTSSKAEDYIFPLLRNDINRSNKNFLRRQVESKTVLINDSLKEIAVLAGIKKNLCSHIARHSFADIARKRNTSLLDIQQLLGHSESKTTQLYLNGLDIESQDIAHENVFEDL